MKMVKEKGKLEESSYLLEYEKRRLLNCAKSFEELAQVFIYTPQEDGNERATEADRHTVLWKKRIVENRELLGSNLREMAGIMGQVVTENVHTVWFGTRKKKQIIHLLEEEGILVVEIYTLKGEVYENRIGIHAKAKKGCTITSSQTAEYLSVLLNRHLQPCSGCPFYMTQEIQIFYFEEEPRLNVLTGFAKAIKETEKISGDNHSFFETENGIFTAILSDGMGSGEKACEDSEAVVDMAEKFMDAGFSVEMTVQMINDALLSGVEEANMSTLDLCSVNLHDGTASFAKIGSAATFIRNEDGVEKIPSHSLPLGIFHKLDITIEQRQIQSGDYIIMLSDGIADCLFQGESEEFAKDLIEGLVYERPTEIANYIMKYVLSVSKGRIRDDMTVLVMGFWENTYED